jgi:hypothetical protein
MTWEVDRIFVLLGVMFLVLAVGLYLILRPPSQQPDQPTGPESEEP